MAEWMRDDIEKKYSDKKRYIQKSLKTVHTELEITKSQNPDQKRFRKLEERYAYPEGDFNPDFAGEASFKRIEHVKL